MLPFLYADFNMKKYNQVDLFKLYTEGFSKAELSIKFRLPIADIDNAILEAARAFKEEKKEQIDNLSHKLNIRTQEKKVLEDLVADLKKQIDDLYHIRQSINNLTAENSKLLRKLTRLKNK